MCRPGTRSGLAGSQQIPVVRIPQRARRSRDGKEPWMAGKRPGTRVTAARPVVDRLDQLKPDAIGIAQATVIGMATSAPAATVAISLAVIAATTAYSSGLILLIAAVPMLIIANAYRRLNLWSANCGASFEWVGRAISPYLGFLTGWLMMDTYIVGTVAGVIVLGPRSEEHTSELQSPVHLVCRLLLEKKKKQD